MQVYDVRGEQTMTHITSLEHFRPVRCLSHIHPPSHPRLLPPSSTSCGLAAMTGRCRAHPGHYRCPAQRVQQQPALRLARDCAGRQHGQGRPTLLFVFPPPGHPHGEFVVGGGGGMFWVKCRACCSFSHPPTPLSFLLLARALALPEGYPPAAHRGQGGLLLRGWATLLSLHANQSCPNC